MNIRPLTGIAEVEAVESVIDSARDRCLFLLGIHTGLRGSELVAIRVGDARRTVSTGGALNSSHELRSKTRSHSRAFQPPQTRLSLGLDEHALKALSKLLDERAGAADDDLLFVTADGHGLSADALTRIWKRWGTKAGLPGRLTSYSGRLTFISRMGHLPLVATVVQSAPYDFREPMS
jgi:integrase